MGVVEWSRPISVIERNRTVLTTKKKIQKKSQSVMGMPNFSSALIFSYAVARVSSENSLPSKMKIKPTHRMEHRIPQI